MCFKALYKKIAVFCIIGFVVGIIFAFIMPPIVIAVIEGLLLAFLCVFYFLG